jgi:hypothetical protein
MQYLVKERIAYNEHAKKDLEIEEEFESLKI